MHLLDEVKSIFDRLAPLGWGDWFKQHGLDITASDLAAECQKRLPAIQRDLSGMGDYSTSGMRGFEAGKPGLSLIYHALASPAVHPTTDGTPCSNPAIYPSIKELDVLENYIFSLAKRSLSDFSSPVIAVFAYQYRIAENSPHKQHADMGYCRCGVSRIGTEPARYDAQTRSFISTPATAERGAAILPARYGVFLAERRAPTASDAVFRAAPTDQEQTFLFPVHKLFAGDECLVDENGNAITIDSIVFDEHHVAAKLKRLHTQADDNPDFVPPLAIFDINQPPFYRDSTNTPDLTSMECTGASMLLVPSHHDQLARTATQQVDGKDELVRFVVPSSKSHGRFFSSLLISSTGSGRAAPEYVNIRHRVVGEPGQQTTEDLNLKLSTADFDQLVIQDGGYEAAHFIDDSCDGFISATVTGLDGLETRHAFSLVTAVDFFPQIRQLDIQRWVEDLYDAEIGLSLNNIENRKHFTQGGPRPLSDGRFSRPGKAKPEKRSPNLALIDPATNSPAFPRSESISFTVSAIVGATATGAAFDPSNGEERALSWLPDAAADVFAPGWDVSTHRNTYASYGLGSPFLEDAKLCAALNSYWPAAAPDSSRTFNITWSPTAQPLLDSELGYHPNHQRVKQGEVDSVRGWDGEYGPFVETADGKRVVNCAHRNRSDYVSNALAGNIGFNGLDTISAAEMIQRMDVLRVCFDHLANQTVPQTSLWLVHAEQVSDWTNWNSQVLPKADNTLTGAGYIYQFARAGRTATEVAENPITRVRYPLNHIIEFQISSTLIVEMDDGKVKRHTADLTLT